LTLAAAAQAEEIDIGQLVVWPEATLRAYLRVDEGQRRRVRRLLSLLHQPLMIGALDLPASGIGELNAAYLFTAAGSRSPAVQTYHKRKLIPFAEYIPGSAAVASLLRWHTIGNFIVGEDGPPLQVQRGVQVAPAICFEVLQPGAFNRMVHDGATLLVNLSDDAWFAGTTEVQQHLAMSVMRAVETRRWLARASDSGISAFIDPAGRIIAKLDEGVIGAVQKTVTLERALSPYVRFGNWIAPACFMLLAGHGLVAVGKRLRAIAAR
jgi:apolipoprotein N-acyltransferase